MTKAIFSTGPDGAGRREFLRRSTRVATGIALAGPLGLAFATQDTRKPPHPHGTDAPTAVLAERAEDYLQQILEVARGPGGLIIGHTQFDTRRPLQEGEPLHPNLYQVLDSVWGPATPKPTVPEWYYGENTLWATGWLLWSQMARHRVTGDAEALAVARKCFRDINHVFDFGRPTDPGLLAKPHGGRAGQTTSFDQSGNPVLLYVQFAREYGTTEEKEQARRNMLDHGEYYLRHDWVVNHHGNLTRFVDKLHPSAMKYLACAHAAYDLTGEERFREPVVKYVRQIVAAGLLPWPGQKYELNNNLFYYSWLAEYWRGTSLASATDWVANIGAYWAAAQSGLDEEGVLLDGIYDTKEKKFTPTTEGWFDRSPPSAGSKQVATRWWRSPTGYQGRTMYTLAVAILGLIAHKNGLDDRAPEISRKILLRLNRDTMRQCWDNGRLPLEMQPFANMFAAELPGQWLIAYWMGREQGVW